MLLHGIVDSENEDEIKDYITQTEDLFEKLIFGLTPSSEMFLAHGDAAPNNFVFANDGNLLMLDFEHAELTPFQPIAQLLDLGNFFARSWENRELQQVFLKSVIEYLYDDKEYNYEFAKLLCLYRPLFLSSLGVEKDNPEHDMFNGQIRSISDNLTYIKLLMDEQFTYTEIN